MSSSASRREHAAREKAERKLAKEAICLDLQYQPEQLRFHGPVITTWLTVTDSHRAAMTAAGEAIPNRVACRFLLDTGADGCVVKHEIAIQAGLKLINANAPLQGVGVDTTGKAYMGRVLFTVQSKILHGAMHDVYVDTQVMSGDLKSDRIDGLIGRDVLTHFVMSYDGKTGLVKLRYHRPAS
jgi:hypothetical protein